MSGPKKTKEGEEDPAEEKEPQYWDEKTVKKFFRIKGRSGVFMLKVKNNWEGRCGVLSLNGDRTSSASTDDLHCLGEMEFHKDPGLDNIFMVDVFNNLHNYQEKCGNLPIEDLSRIMGIMVPMYDPGEFKDYHAKKVIEWYVEIDAKIKEELNGNTGSDKKKD